jgi:hypothetical protein
MYYVLFCINENIADKMPMQIKNVQRDYIYENIITQYRRGKKCTSKSAPTTQIEWSYFSCYEVLKSYIFISLILDCIYVYIVIRIHRQYYFIEHDENITFLLILSYYQRADVKQDHYMAMAMVRRGSVWCGVAQLAARRLAVRQARVRFSARHHREVFPTEHTSDEDMERLQRMAMDECIVIEWMYVCYKIKINQKEWHPATKPFHYMAHLLRLTNSHFWRTRV